jgi:hypothetical protein
MEADARRLDSMRRRPREKGAAVTLKCYYCGKKISHYSTESEVGDIYVLILPWRWRFSRYPITK